MKRPRPGVGSEMVPVALILIGLAGTLALVVAMHRKAAFERAAGRAKTTASAVPPPPPVLIPKSEETRPAPPIPVVVEAPAPPVEDPTIKSLARIAAESAENRSAARESDRRAAALEKARKDAAARSRQSRRREALVKAQVDGLDQKARALEAVADALAVDRDVLAHERDAAKAALAKANSKGGGYAVLPHQGPNGTWQRPVVIECRDGTAILQPKGQSFSLVDLSSTLGPRSSPLVAAVARELIRIYRSGGPEGETVVPYIYFIIRPDGIRPYYEARARLEPLGIAFGYELADQKMEIDFPDFDDLTAWDGSGAPKLKDATGAVALGGSSGGDFVWPVDRKAAGASDGMGRGDGGGKSRGDGPDKYLWPTQTTANGNGNGNGEGNGDVPADGSGLDSPGTPGGTSRSRGRNGVGPNGATRPGPMASLGGNGGGSESGPLTSGGPGGGMDGGPGGANHGPTTDVNGLVPVNPGMLPGLDHAGEGTNGSRTGGTGDNRPGQGAVASGRRIPLPPLPLGSLTPPSVAGLGSSRFADPRSPLLALAPYLPRGKPSSGSGAGLGATLPPASPGRVRIDPDQIAQDDDPFGDHEPPSGEDTGRAGPSSPSSTGRAGGSGSPSEPSSGSSTGGIGQPSSSGGQNGPIGLGTPSLGSSSAARSSDVRPRRSKPPAWAPTRETTVDAALDLVVACGKDRVVIHPGGYRLSLAALKKPGSLTRDLETIVHNHALIDPSVRPRPRLQFLVEPGGSETYQEARKQSVLSGLNWPVTIQVAGPPAPGVFPKERF